MKQGAGFLRGESPFRLKAVPQALNAVLSRGESYEPVPPGRRFERDRLAGYYMDFRAKTTSETPSEALLPAALAQLGLGWWERLLDGESDGERHILAACALLLDGAVERDGELRWLHDVPVSKYRLASTWASALAQGQIASLFLRAAALDDGKRLRDAGRRAALPLLSRTTTDLVTLTDRGPVLEEAPTNPRSHILNGWISALWGVLDVAIEFADDTAHAAYTQGWQCVRDVLPHYDTGWWTKYSLYPSRPVDLAKPIYHRFHVDQLHVLAALTDEAVFTSTAERWDAYDTPLNRVRFLGQKTAFVAAYAGGRLKVGEPSLAIE